MAATDRLLSPEDLRQLTGAVRHRRQKDVLARSGIRYVERIDGSPAVTWEAVNAALASKPAKPVRGPDLDWMQPHGEAKNP